MKTSKVGFNSMLTTKTNLVYREIEEEYTQATAELNDKHKNA